MAPSFLDSEEPERSGAELGSTGRLQMMARLSEGETSTRHRTNPTVPTLICSCPSTCNRYKPSDGSLGAAGSADDRSHCYRSNGSGFGSVGLHTPSLWLSRWRCCSTHLHQRAPRLPTNRQTCLSAAMNPVINMNIPAQPLATHCFQLSNMFSPSRYTHTQTHTHTCTRTDTCTHPHSSLISPPCVFSSELPPGWELDIQHDVIEECTKHGGVVHIYVDKNSAEVSRCCEVVPAWL